MEALANELAIADLLVVYEVLFHKFRCVILIRQGPCINLMNENNKLGATVYV